MRSNCASQLSKKEDNEMMKDITNDFDYNDREDFEVLSDDDNRVGSYSLRQAIDAYEESKEEVQD
jgi:hypothetical protein